MDKVVKSKTVSDFVIDRLSAWKVKHVFGYPGDGINGLLGAWDRHENAPQFVLLPHEEHAGFAACAHAKFTGELGVCLSTSGPGALHLLTGLFDARMDHQPLLALIGQQATYSLGASYQQEIDLLTLLRPSCGYVAEINHPAQILHAMDRAMRVATAERTAVAIILPRDIQMKELEFPPHEHGVNYSTLSPVLYTSETIPPRELLEEAAQLLNSAQRPALLVGAGALGASAEVREVAELLGAGVCKALLGKCVLSDDDSFVCGTLGQLGTPASQQLMKQCDALFLIGTSFPYCESLPLPGQVRAVHLDCSASRVGLRYSSSVNLVGGTRETLRALLPLLRKNTSSAQQWRSRVEEFVRSSWSDMRHRAMQSATPLNPQRIFFELSEHLPRDSIVTADSGTSTVWLGRLCRMSVDMKFSVSGSLSSMGCALPYAVAAKLAHPHRPVLAVVGDGAMQMSGLGLLIRIAELSQQWADKRFVILVLRNQELSQVTWEQRMHTSMRKFAASQNIPDFSYVPLARQLGFDAHVLDNPDNVSSMWKTAFSRNGIVFIDAITDAQVPVMAPEVTPHQIESLVKAVKQGDENRERFLAQLAKENSAVSDSVKKQTAELG